MCDTTWDAVLDKIRDAMNRETPVIAEEIGSDGHERYACPLCGTWWYGKKNNYCYGCGQKITY